jgi:hypothetical protein
MQRLMLVWAPIALLMVMNPVLDLGSWPRLWRDVLHVTWGGWSVVACSLDATRGRPVQANGGPQPAAQQSPNDPIEDHKNFRSPD